MARGLTPQVRCNSVHPAFLEGPMVDTILARTRISPMRRAPRITRDIPLGRLGTPAEVADMCVYLLSDESRFVTGAEFVIDGGMTAPLRLFLLRRLSARRLRRRALARTLRNAGRTAASAMCRRRASP